VKKVEKLREAKGTTLRRVRHSCAMGGKDVVGEVKGVDELGVRICVQRVEEQKG
jgi:hypothetical protein